MKRALLTFLLILAGLMPATTLTAQELKCDVRVNANQVEGSDRTIFQNLQTALYEFLNNTKFTDINIRQSEKIECSILINVRSRDNDYFTAEINVASNRPIYKSNYNSPMFNYLDKNFIFQYTDGQALDFNPTTYISNLTSTLGFYVYLILGLDFDSFSLYGGEPFFELAETIANAAPQDSNGDGGWNSTGRQNRHAIISEFNNETYRPLRQFLYDYHRNGLDVMSEKPDQGRDVILNAMQSLQSIYERNSMCYILQLIVETKRDEIIQVFSEGSQKEKTTAANIMKTIDPSQSSRYDVILQNPGR
jgi:hypothetical protein